MKENKTGLNSGLLRMYQQRAGKTGGDVAEGIGIHSGTYNTKINGHREFTVAEAALIRRELKLSAEEYAETFGNY